MGSFCVRLGVLAAGLTVDGRGLVDGVSPLTPGLTTWLPRGLTRGLSLTPRTLPDVEAVLRDP